MSYESINTHSERYSIYGKMYTAKVDFLKNKLFITSSTGEHTYDLDEYENFYGNMKEFVEHKIKE